jgi:hypothetical protein
VKIREFKLEMDSTVDPSRIEEFEAIKDAWVNDNMSELQNEQLRVKAIEVEAETGKILVTVEVLAGLTLEGM